MEDSLYFTEKKLNRVIGLLSKLHILKEMHKLKILKLKDFITLQNMLFVNDYREEERMKRKSFNTTFKQMKTNQFHNTRSINTHQLKRRTFKTEKYDRFSILSKGLSDWNLLHKGLKTNFKKIKRSEIKALVANHLFEKYTK